MTISTAAKPVVLPPAVRHAKAVLVRRLRDDATRLETVHAVLFGGFMSLSQAGGERRRLRRGGAMRVVNVREAGGWAAFVALRGIYLGRSRHLGNPFTVGVHGCRDCVLEQYEDWLFRQLTAPNRTVQMALSRLPPDAVIGCSAWRHPCHCCHVRLAYLWWAREGHRLYGGARADLQQAWARRGEAGSAVEPQESGPAALQCPGPRNRFAGAIEMEATRPRAEKQSRKFSITFTTEPRPG
jgi:hypothetical protein